MFLSIKIYHGIQIITVQEMTNLQFVKHLKVHLNIHVV